MKRIAMKIGMLVAALALALSFTVPAFASTYYGPSLQTPVAIKPGGTINLVLTTGSSSSFVAAPEGSTLCAAVVSGNTATCTFPLQDCTSGTAGLGFYYSIHEITVTDPNGNEYMLGSAVTSGLNWPADLGGSGSTAVPPQAPALNVTSGNSFTVPFGTGAGGFSFASTLPNPPNNAMTGPYYWWTVQGNSNGNNLRLDQNPSIQPTLTHGAYRVDVEGTVVCGSTTQQLGTIVFFDAGLQVTTPQFGLATAGAGIAVALAFVGLVLLRKKSLKLPISSAVN